MTRKNNIYTLLITFIAFRSVILSKFPTLYFPYKLSFYAWATCGKPCVMSVRGHNNVERAVQTDPTLRFADHGRKEMLEVIGSKV